MEQSDLQERYYPALLQHATDLIAVLSCAGFYLYASPSHERFLGYAVADLRGMYAPDLIHPDDRLRLQNLFRAAVDADHALTARARVRHADGSWRTLEIEGHHLHPEGDEPVVIINSWDVTERIAFEQALQAEQGRLEVLLQSSRILASSLDRYEILSQLTDRLLTALGACSAAVMDVDSTTGKLYAPVQRTVPHQAPFIGDTLDQLGGDLLSPVGANGGAQLRYSRLDHPWCPPVVRERLVACGVATELLVPIRAHHSTVGLLALHWDTPLDLSPETLVLCAAIADQAAMALEHVRIYAAEAALRSRAEARARRIEHLQRVGEWLKADLGEAEIARRLVEGTQGAVGFRANVLNLVDEPENPHALWRVVATVGIPPEGVADLCNHPFTVADIQKILQPRFAVSRSYFIPAEESTVFEGSAVPRWIAEHSASGPNAWRGGDELLVPLTDSTTDALIGLLSFDAPENGQRPTREDIELLELFADQAVVALRNAQRLARARHAAERDSVTELLNHRAAHTYLERTLAITRADAGFGLLAIDMDGFKLINDTYGHPTGDRALRHVADLLTRCGRSGDVPARLGGDEFLLILPGATLVQSIEVAQRLLTLAHEAPLYLDDGDPIPLRLSVGVAACPEDAATPNALLTIADTRLYEAKRSGRSQAVEPGQRSSDDNPLVGFDILSALVTAVDNKDRYTHEHSEQVATIACALAERLGLSRDTVRTLRAAGLLHDVGKIGVPDRVLRKPGRLLPDEWEAMKQHAVLSDLLVRTVVGDPEVQQAVAHHHERWDGDGYPFGLARYAVSLPGRIMIVADAVSAMAMDRPYRKGLSQERIIAELRAGAGTQFDPALVEPCIAILARALAHIALATPA